MSRVLPSRQNGMVTLIAVLLLLALVGLVLVTGLHIAGTDVSDSGAQNQSVEALMLAESGLERAAYNYSVSNACDAAGVGAGATQYGFGNGNFVLVSSVAPVRPLVSGSNCIIRVTGTVGSVTRTVDGWFSSGGAIAVETWNSNSGTSSGRIMTVALPVAGTGRFLVVGISVDSANSNVNSVTYAGQNLTYLGGSGTGNGRPSAEIWALTNPPTGNSTVRVNLSNNDQLAVGAVVFTGVNQATPLDAPIFGNTGNSGTSTTATLNTVTNNAWVFDVLALNNGVTPNMGGLPGRTERWNLNVGSSITGAGSTYGPKSPFGTADLTWSWSGNHRWAIEAIALRPGGGAPVLTTWSEVVQ